MRTKMIVLTAFVGLLFTACNSNEYAPSENDEMVLKSAQIAVDDMTAESVMDEIDYDVSVFAESEKILKQLANYKGSLNLDRANMGKRYKGENNPIVTVDATEGGYPVLITVDYGEETQLNNGRTISGVVSIEVSAPRETDGATRTVTYSNCIIDSVQVDGVTIETTRTDGENSRTVSTSSKATSLLTVILYLGLKITAIT